MRICVAVVGSVLVGCAAIGPTHSFTAEQEEVARAVFGHLIAGDYALPSAKNRPIALCMPGDSDPPALIASQIGSLEILPCSALKRNSDAPVQFKDSGKGGYKCFITEIVKLPVGFRAEGGCTAGPLSGSGYSYLVKLVDGKWAVVEMEHVWDS